MSLVSEIEEVGDLTLMTWVPEGGARNAHIQIEEAYESIDATLRTGRAVVLQERVFGRVSEAAEILQARARSIGADNEAWAVPPTFVEGAPIGGGDVAGIHVLALRAERSHLVRSGDLVLGRVAETPWAQLLGLADIGRLAGGRVPAVPAEDAAAAIDAAAQVLATEGFSFRDVVRTWYYLRDILSWYGPFNAARNAAFRRMGLIGPDGDGAVPASTGIDGRSSRGAWCALDLMAARALDPRRFEMVRLHNRAQNEATAYGSAFARGMALTLGSHRYFFVSGTASIDDHGATVHVGDFDAQAEHTVEAIQALLEGAGATLHDVRQATAWIKHPGDARHFERIARRCGLDRVPAVTLAGDVCREQLLVEIDATAVVPLGATEDVQ